MKVSVLISSHDRPQGLRKTLESLLCGPNLKEQDWEILVVRDLLKNDTTSSLGREFQQRFPGRIRFLEHNNKGKSLSLNIGISHARGQWLAMIDDDVLCCEGYVAAITETFQRHPADAGQGRVVLDWIGGRPSWITDHAAEFLGNRDYGEQVIAFDRDMAGANMVVRTEVARKIGGFAPELGPGGAGMHEDTEFSSRLRRAGYKQIYAPQILVRHQTLGELLSPALMRRRSFLNGRSMAYYESPCEPTLRLTQWHARNCLLMELRALLLTMRGNHSEALRLQRHSRELLGYLWQRWKFRMGLPRKLSYPLLNGGSPV